MEIKKYCEQCLSVQPHKVVALKDSYDVFAYVTLCIKCETKH